MNRKKIMKWKCIHCPQISERRWNLQVHIARKHNGNGSPLPLDYDSSNVYQTPYANFKNHTKRESSFRGDSGVEPWVYPGDNISPQSNDWLGHMMKINDSVMNLVQKFPKPLYRYPFPPWYFHQPIGNIVSQNTTEYYTENFDGVLGFQVKICEICLTSRIVPSVEYSA